MKTILILGGYGATGRSLARHLLGQTDARLKIAGRHIEAARRFTSELNQGFPGERGQAVRVDAADNLSLRAALEGVDFLINAAPTTALTENVVHSALEAGVDYLDIQIGAEKLAVLKSHAAEIEKAGLCFITEAGYHPGLPAAMVRLAGMEFDQMHSAVTAGYLNIGPAAQYSETVDELMEEFKHYRMEVFRDGEWVKPGSWEMREVDFGELAGTRKCSSMFFEELRPIPGMFPDLKETGFFISGSHWFTDWIIFPLAMVGLKIAPRRGMRPMGRLVWWGMTKVPKPPYIVILKVEADGIKNGHPQKVEITIRHADGYELTAIPVVALLKQVLDGSVRKPGLWMMGHLADPQRLFKDMELMGAEVDKRIWQPGERIFDSQ